MTDSAAIDLRHMSSREFVAWGVQDVAYITKVSMDGGIAYAICAADGTRLGIAPSREVAFAAVKQHELEPVSVH